MLGGTLGRMTTQQQSTIPAGWQGSESTWMVYEALTRRGMEPGVDFDYRPKAQGKRLELDIEVDFMLPPNLALQIQEGFGGHHSGISTRGMDTISRARLGGDGIVMVILQADMIKQDPDWIVSEALQYRDHSME